jgi:CheY-like chemotaxis protein
MRMREIVLIIDDEVALANMAEFWVRSAGYRTVVAYNGNSGLAKVRECRPDVILMDIMMPDLNGFEVVRCLKEDPAFEHVPVIFLSAAVQETARREALAVGAIYFLSKPYEGPELLAAIAAALDSKRTAIARMSHSFSYGGSDA